MLTREPRLNHPAQSCWPLHALHASVPTMAPLLSHRHRRLGPPRIPAIAVAILLLGFASHAVVGPVRAFSAPASSSSDGGITIVGLPGGQVQSLPGMYVKSIRRWIEVEEGGGGNGIIQLEPIPGAGGVGIRDDDDYGIPSGWVDPTSTSDLWWPRDLDSLQVRPALNVLFRSGVLSYVSAGLDVRVPTRRRNDGCRGGGGGDDDGGTGTEPSSSGGVAYKIVCMATSEPFASKLLDLDEDILAMSSTSVLEIDVSRTAEGGKSMYLPEVYKDLYLNGVTHKMSI